MPAGAGPQTLGEYMMSTIAGPVEGVVDPAFAEGRYEIKTGLLLMIQNNQFGGGPTEDPRKHVENFLDILDSVMIPGLTVR